MFDNKHNKLIVAVFKGGCSSEREISLASGEAVATALREAGHFVHEIDLKKNKLPILPDNTQVVFPVLHGSFGEDGGIQALLEDAKIPFVGSSSSASRTIMNKILTKRILEEHAVLTPQYRA
ncbi:MAG: D-alanine--D-alanine ligase, partial [Verrucomicrobiota bacterium]|nr:D-alanine--D-alanine ligase [Verrucomicrobiota bacterium]